MNIQVIISMDPDDRYIFFVHHRGNIVPIYVEFQWNSKSCSTYEPCTSLVYT